MRTIPGSGLVLTLTRLAVRATNGIETPEPHSPSLSWSAGLAAASLRNVEHLGPVQCIIYKA